MPPRRPTRTTFRAQVTRSLPADSWTPDMIRQAEMAADTGQLRWAAELCDALRGDDRVQGAREKLNALFGMVLVFEDGVGRARRMARRALEAQEDWWAAFSDESLGELLFWGVLLGVAVGELIWSHKGGRLVPKLKVWHPRALRYDAALGQWYVRTADGVDVAVVVGDGQWVIFTPFSESDPWQHGAWRAIARWWRLKRYAMFDWGRACEQAAGLKVATCEDGQNDDRDKLVEDLMNIGGDAATALPPGWDMKQLAMPANTKELFDGIISAADTATSITFLGQNLTTQVEGGSFAATSVHQAVSQGIIRARASSLAGCLRSQVWVPWAHFNFDATEAAPWPVWQVDPPQGIGAMADAIDKLAGALVKLDEAGVPYDLDKLAETFGLPLLELAQRVEWLAQKSAARAPVAPPALPAPARAVGLSAAPGGGQLAAAIAGQVYTDAVFDAAMARAPEALDAGVLGAVRRAIADARDYDELRAMLPKILEGTDDTAMQDLLLGAVMCCASAGAFSATQGT